MQVRDVVLRRSNNVILWINLFRERQRIHGRHVSGKSRVGDCKAVILLICFINSRYRLPMPSLRETLTPAGVLSLVSSQKLDPSPAPLQHSSSAMFFTVWKGSPFVFCAKMLKSCWFIHTTSAVLPSKSRPSRCSRTSSSSTSRSKPSRYVKNFAKSGHSEFRKILTWYCQSSYSSYSPPKMGMSLHPFEHARLEWRTFRSPRVAPPALMSCSMRFNLVTTPLAAP